MAGRLCRISMKYGASKLCISGLERSPKEAPFGPLDIRLATRALCGTWWLPYTGAPADQNRTLCGLGGPHSSMKPKCCGKCEHSIRKHSKRNPLEVQHWNDSLGANNKRT